MLHVHNYAPCVITSQHRVWEQRMAFGAADRERRGGEVGVRVETCRECVVIHAVFEFIDCALLRLINIVVVDGL